jgi:hypothetical protein
LYKLALREEAQPAADIQVGHHIVALFASSAHQAAWQMLRHVQHASQKSSAALGELQHLKHKMRDLEMSFSTHDRL